MMFGQSHPARGAWIEIGAPKMTFKTSSSRTPQGVRGLKFRIVHAAPAQRKSHPARGAWIEILIASRGREPLIVAPRKGCVD